MPCIPKSHAWVNQSINQSINQQLCFSLGDVLLLGTRTLLIGSSPAGLSIYVKFAHYRMKMTIPASERFFLSRTLQGIQYQFIKAAIYQPTLLPESRRKFRNVGSSQDHTVSLIVRAVSRHTDRLAKSKRLSHSAAEPQQRDAISKNTNANNSRARRAAHSSLGQRGYTWAMGDRKWNV